MSQPHPEQAGSRAKRTMRGGLAMLLAVLVLLAGAPMAGCVEMSRTEKSRFGNPLQSHSAGPRNTFEADSYKPPTAAPKPWYERLFDW